MAVDPKPLEYDRSSQPFATRRQFRVLMLLVIMQLCLSIQSIYAPGMLGMIRQWLADRRVAAAHAAEIRQAAALEQQCLQFAQPSTKVVWEEDPGEAAKLLKLEGYRAIAVHGDWNDATKDAIHNGIPPGAFAPNLGATRGLVYRPGRTSAPAFLHARTSARGAQRLVVVWISGGNTLSDSVSGRDRVRTFTIAKGQAFDATAYVPTNGGKRLDDSEAVSTTLSIHPDSDRLEMPLQWTPSSSPDKPGRVRIDRRDVLRVYAGQPDPADASHFTIAYTLDGKPGVIDGRLLDSDRVELKPRIGTVIGDRWYPRARTNRLRPPATHKVHQT